MLTTRRTGQKRALAMLLAFVMVVTGCFGSMGPAVANAASTLVTETPALAVTGQGVVTGGVYSLANVGLEKSYTLNELKTIAATDTNRFANDLYNYSWQNTFGTKRLYLGEGVRLDTLLTKSGVSGTVLSDTVISVADTATPAYVVRFDPARTTFGESADSLFNRTTEAFSVARYYYPNYLSGSSEGATQVPAIIAWANNYSITAPAPTTVSPKSGLVLMTGQLGLTDYNSPQYNSAAKLVQVGDAVAETVLTVGSTQLTRAKLLMMDRATSAYTYTTSTGTATDVARGVPMSVLLASYDDNDVVTFTTADGYPVSASGKTKAELVANDYMIAYEKGTTTENLAGIYSTAKSDPAIYGLCTLYGADAEGKPSKMVTSISVTPATGPDYANSPYKHINNGGLTQQSGPYDVDAITSATLTVEGPGVETSIPLSVRTVEEQNAGAYRGVYSDTIVDQTNTKNYEGIKLSYILNDMPDASKVTLTDGADRVVIKNRARQSIATFTLAQIAEADAAGKPIIVAYGVGTTDESQIAPFVYDGQAGSIPGIYNEDGCLKLVYDKTSITGDVNTAYTTFGNMAYIYVEEGDSPGYNHDVSPYNDPDYTQFLLSLTGTGMGREINLTVAQLEAMVTDDSAGANTLADYTSGNMGLRKAYSLTNTSYWSVNEYEGLKLYNLLSYFNGNIKPDSAAPLADNTPIRFNAWDGYLSNEAFTLADLRNPDNFGYYEKNALDLGDGTYVPVAEDLKSVGYPVMLAYGVNEYPYVKTPSDIGFANGLNNSGGPLRVIFGKRDYFTNNGSNQVQKVDKVIVGDDTYDYSTHKYHSNSIYTAMASDSANDLQVVVKDADGNQLKQLTYSLGDLEDIIYGADVPKIESGLAKSKAYFELNKNGSKYSDLYEGVNLNYFIKNLLEVPGVKGTVTFSDGTNSVQVSLEQVLALGANPQSGVDNLPATLAFAKNGAPMVPTKLSPGYESTFTLGDSTTFTVKNDGGPLALLIPSTTGSVGISDAISLANVKSITIDMQADSYTHSNAPYSDLSENTVTVTGAGTYLATAKDFTVAELEGKQTIAVTADYNIKDAISQNQIRYRGLDLYDFLKSSAVGLRLNADKVIVTGYDGTVVEFSIADIMRSDLINGQNGSINNLGTMLAFGSSSVDTIDLEDGLPLVLDISAAGYNPTYQNSGGPIKLVTGQTDVMDQNAGRTVVNVKSIEVTAAPTVAQNHSVNDIFKTYLNDTFTVRIQNADNSSSYTKVYTVAELEAMSDLIVNDEFTWIGIQQHEGLNLWELIQKTEPSLTDDTALSSVNVYDGTFTKDVLSIFGKTALQNGITDSANPEILKPIILAYSQNGLPLVATTTSDGYSETAGNTGGPLRLITHENQGACVRNADGVTVVLSGTGSVDDPNEDLTLTVDGQEMTFAVSELKGMASTTLNYAKKSATPNRTAKGVLLYDLLKAQGVTNPDALVSFSTPDNFQDSSKAVGYKEVTLRDIKAQQYLVAYSGADVADSADETLVDFNDLVKGTTTTTKLRVYRNYTTDAAQWWNEMTNITGIDAQDYAIAIKTDSTTLRLTLDDLKAMKATTDTYLVKDIEKSVTGALLSDILTVMGVDKPQTTISLVTYDNFNHATYSNIKLEDIKSQDYLIAYLDGATPISDLVKNDTARIDVRVYRHYTSDVTKWYNEVTSPVTISATNTQYDFDQWSGMPVSGIRSIQQDNSGGYWVGTYGGGLVRKLASGTTTVYNLTSTPALDTAFVSAIAPDQAGGIWFSQNASYTNPGENKGLVYMNATGELTKYTVETMPGTIPDNYVQALYLDSGSLVGTEDDVLWIGTFAGLTKYEIGTDTWTTYAKTTENTAGFPATSVTTITPSGDGDLWVGFYPEGTGTGLDGSYTGGCIKFDVSAGAADPTFTQHYSAPYDASIGSARLADAWVRSIAVDSAGGAYIVRAGSTVGLTGTVGGHVDYIAPDGTATSYTGSELLGGMLTGSSEIRSITIGSDGSLWFGTSANGVAYCEPPVAGTAGEVLKAYNSQNQAWIMTNPISGISTYDNVYVTAIIGDTLLVGSAGGVATIPMTAATALPEPPALTIYDHTTVKGEFSLELLNAMTAVEGDKRYNYAGYNTTPTWKTSLEAYGPTLESLFEQAGVDLEALSGDTLISFVAGDGYTVKFTKAQIMADRYYYPNGNVGTANGALGGASALEGKILVPAIINLKNGGSTLSMGQFLPNEQTWDGFNQMMAEGGKIIIGDAASNWNPVAVAGTRSEGLVSEIPSGSDVEAGTIIDFTRPNGSANKVAKIFYTLDGTDPTTSSTFYNYNEYAGATGATNHILLDQTGDVTIKTIVSGRGGLDSAVSTFTYHVVPKAPVELTASGISIHGTKLTWNASDGATGYNVYRGLTAGTVTELIAANQSSTSFTDANLSTNTKYYYQVAAIYGENEGGKTEVVGAYTLLPAPKVTAQSTGYNSVKVSWASIVGAAGYKVYRYNPATKQYALIGTTSATSYSNTGLTSGTSYAYLVKAYRNDGATPVIGEAGLPASAKPIPAATTAFTAKSNGYNSIKLAWRAVPGATGYYVYRYNPSTKTFAYIGSASGTTLTNTSSALISGKTYQYKVRAYRLVGATKVGGAFSVIKSAIPIPSAPKIALTKMTSTSIKINWSGVSGASYYEIYRKSGTNGTWIFVGKSKYASSRAWTNINLIRGKTYYYKVRACRIVGSKVVKGAFSTTAGKAM
jgi:fibronectin type 3 domain-containing protein